MGIRFSGLQDVVEPPSNLCLGMERLWRNVLVAQLEMTKTEKRQLPACGRKIKGSLSSV